MKTQLVQTLFIPVNFFLTFLPPPFFVLGCILESECLICSEHSSDIWLAGAPLELSLKKTLGGTWFPMSSLDKHPPQDLGSRPLGSSLPWSFIGLKVRKGSLWHSPPSCLVYHAREVVQCEHVWTLRFFICCYMMLKFLPQVFWFIRWSSGWDCSDLLPVISWHSFSFLHVLVMCITHILNALGSGACTAGNNTIFNQSSWSFFHCSWVRPWVEPNLCCPLSGLKV